MSEHLNTGAPEGRRSIGLALQNWCLLNKVDVTSADFAPAVDLAVTNALRETLASFSKQPTNDKFSIDRPPCAG
jgi:hypothetical protein